MSGVVGVTGYVEPAPHEFAANYLFDANGLAPFFAADSQVKAGGGSQCSEFYDRGNRWTVTLYYQDSNIVHPGSQLLTGTDWRLDEMRGFRLKVKRHKEEDPIGQQSFNAHITPRWQGMKVEKRDGLDQTVLSVLADAGLDVAPSRGTGPFVRDAYFEVETTEDGPGPIGLDLTHIRSTQESVVVRYLVDGLSPVQWESLQTLVTDGGEVSPATIADEHDRHVESVRRALHGIEDLVVREYAKVSLRSNYVAELVHDAVQEAEEAVKRAAETGAKVIRVAEQGMEETMSVFIAWAARHGIDVDDALSRREARMKLRVGEPGRETCRAIKEGFRIWKEAGLPEERFRMAKIRFRDGGLSDAWRYLNPG